VKLSETDSFFLVLIAYFLGCPVYMVLIQRHDHEIRKREGVETPPNE
jgi:hypothetical protein